MDFLSVPIILVIWLIFNANIRTLSIVKINKGPTAPNIGPKRMVLNARCLAKPDAAPALYTELSNNKIDLK